MGVTSASGGGEVCCRGAGAPTWPGPVGTQPRPAHQTTARLAWLSLWRDTPGSCPQVACPPRGQVVGAAEGAVALGEGEGGRQAQGKRSAEVAVGWGAK